MKRERTRTWVLSTLALLIIALAMPARALAGGDEYGEYELHGTIEQLPGAGLIGDWTVSGRTIHVTGSTWVKQEHGRAAVGAPVEVKGDLLADGTVNALKVEIEGPGSGGGGDDNDGGFDDEIHGTIEQLPASGLVGDWVVGGRIVHVSASTSIEQEHGRAAVGAPVEVHGIPQSDGSIDAARIEVYPSHGGSRTGGEAKFFGTVESMPAGSPVGIWVVSGRSVRVSGATVIEREHGIAPAVGSVVEVEGAQLEDGSVAARKIEVKTAPGSSSSTAYFEYRATVESLPPAGSPGDWTVGGRTVHASEATRIEQRKGQAQPGALVEVRGSQRADGSVDAGAIEVKKASGGKSRYAKFYGTIEILPAAGLVGVWMVSGQSVDVTDRTLVKQELGAAVAGALVEVTGKRQADGSLLATKIEVKDGTGAIGGSGYIEFRGTVESLPASGLVGEWIVSGRRVHAGEGIRLRGTIRVGTLVEVEGSQRTDGSIDASKVHVED